MKVWIREYESWPVYSLEAVEDWAAFDVDLSEDDVDDFKRVEAEFEAWRLRLFDIYERRARVVEGEAKARRRTQELMHHYHNREGERR